MTIDPRDPLALAQGLIRCASVTPEDGGAIGYLESVLAGLGFTCHRLAFGEDMGRPRIENLYARIGTDGPHLCFAGHTDVVPVGTGWSVDPFAALVRDGQLFGRGAADMKGGVACFTAAVARHLAKGPLKGSISFLITGDEEARALDGTVRVLDWMETAGERPDWCLVGEPTNPERIGEVVKIGRRGSLNGRLLIQGVQGHAAYPQLADNPIPHLLKLLAAITAEPLDQGSEHFQPSVLTITTIDVGNKATNVIPGEARAGFNIRFNDRHSGRSLEADLRCRLDAVGTPYALEIEVSGESFITQTGPFTEAVSRAIKAETGLTPDLNTTGGTSDARFIQRLCPVVEFGMVGKTSHKADEHVAVADLETLTRIYERLLGDGPGRTC